MFARSTKAQDWYAAAVMCVLYAVQFDVSNLGPSNVLSLPWLLTRGLRLISPH